MPRIVPLQLLKCLKVLLDDMGGILSTSEVKRIAGLMTKYSKKLVSKCIYVQILKSTKTELLGEFMAVGGWSLVISWLNDAIRAMNWPLVQEVLELLLLSPVDVNRLKINSAPKLVKSLCKEGGNEGVRILARRLVDQWLKIVTENQAENQIKQMITNTTTNNSTPTPTNAITGTTSQVLQHHHQQQLKSNATALSKTLTNSQMVINNNDLKHGGESISSGAKDTTTYMVSSKAKTGLVYKIIVKNGHQVLAKVARQESSTSANERDEIDINNEKVGFKMTAAKMIDVDEDSKLGKETSGSSGDEEVSHKHFSLKRSDSIEKKHHSSSEKERSDKKENRASSESKDRDRKSKSDREKEKEKDRKGSSSHKSSSSSSHKSSSSKPSSKSKSSSSSSSSSHRSSSEHKHKSDKDRGSSSSSSSKDKDKDRRGESSSSKHRSSSSSKSSSSSSSKDRHREKDKDKTTSSSSSTSTKKDKEREKELQAEKDKNTLSKMAPPSLDKLGKIPKKPKDETATATTDSSEAANKSTSITIPSRKASMSIEIRKDSEKTSTVKTYKSQFRSHGLTEEAPPPPSRKGLKKPTAITTGATTVIPSSLPSSLKRSSPPPLRDSPTEKKAKIDITNVNGSTVDKPGGIKLIAPKKIQTLVETNLFSDALSAATGPKKLVKRKRPLTPGLSGSGTPPTSPDTPKLTPLKFYQDTLDETKMDDKSGKELEDGENNTKSKNKDNQDKSDDDVIMAKEANTEDDDDVPLKKVKEDIEKKVDKETDGDAVVKVPSESDEEEKNVEREPKKPGPGCGPNGPPGVLMLHRRKGPKKKLTWRAPEQLEQIRYFELDETERVNVTKSSSFLDMKNLERFNERDAMIIARRNIPTDDTMEPQTAWKPLIEVDDVPVHPDGSQSKQRRVQTEREMTTLRALYFSHAMIPDSPAEAELEPHFTHDTPLIPLEDITGNPDAVNDFTNMPWPEPKGSPKHGDSSISGTGGLGGLGVGPGDMFGNSSSTGSNPFGPFNSGSGPFAVGLPNAINSKMPPSQISGPKGIPPPGWQGPAMNGVGPNGPMMGNVFNNNMGGSPNMGGPPQNFMGQFGSNGQSYGPAGPVQYNPPGGFNAANNFGAMKIVNAMMNGSGPMMNGVGPRGNNRNNGGWRTGNMNFPEGGGGGGGGGGPGGGNNWRPAGPGQNRSNNNNNNNNGVCKAFMRGNCRNGKSCKFIHVSKSKRL